MKATYNITDDKLKAWFDERLPKDTYDRMRRAGFTFWHGRKCFAAKWSTQAEDILIELGQTIEEDDTPDDVESRVERFAGYADKAASSAESAENYLNNHANTERRQRNAINAIQRETAAATHWNERIAASISHAQRKDRPDVIARRIEGLQKDLRKFTKHADRAQWSIPSECFNMDVYRKYSARKHELNAELNAKKGTEEQWTPERKQQAIEELRGLKVGMIDEAKATALFSSQKEWADRWIAHINNRLLYESACLEAAGGIVAGAGYAPIDKGTFIKGGAIRTRRDPFRLITKVNKRTVEVYDPNCNWRHFWKVDRTEIEEVLSPEQVKERFPTMKLPEGVKV